MEPHMFQAENQKGNDEALTRRYTDNEKGLQWERTKNTDLELLHSAIMAIYSDDTESSLEG